jgi:hypothetical protein
MLTSAVRRLPGLYTHTLRNRPRYTGPFPYEFITHRHTHQIELAAARSRGRHRTPPSLFPPDRRRKRRDTTADCGALGVEVDD